MGLMGIRQKPFTCGTALGQSTEVAIPMSLLFRVNGHYFKSGISLGIVVGTSSTSQYDFKLKLNIQYTSRHHFYIISKEDRA